MEQRSNLNEPASINELNPLGQTEFSTIRSRRTFLSTLIPSHKKEIRETPEDQRKPTPRFQQRNSSQISMRPFSKRQVLPETLFSESKLLISAYKAANYDTAVRYQNKMSYRKLVRNFQVEDYEQLEVSDSNEKLKQYGLGIYLHFQFIKRLIITLLIMSAVLILPLVYSYSCNNLSTYEPSFTLTLAKFSLGNIYRADRTGYLIITCADIVSMLVFFVFYLHWRHFHADTVAMMEIDQVFLNPTSYAVTVNGVAEVGPEMTCELLKEYIQKIVSKPDSVYECEIIYDYHGNFEKFVEFEEKYELVENQKQNNNKSQRQNEELKELQKQLTDKMAELAELKHIFTPRSAIIHFQTLQNKLAFINFCRHYHLINSMGQSLYRCLCCPRKLPKQLKLLNQYTLQLQVGSLSRPQQINWKNSDFSKLKIVYSWLLSLLLMLIAIIITSALIVFSTLYVSSTSSCQSYNANTTIDAAIAAQGATLYCYCSYHFSEILTNSTVSSACGSLSNTILITNILQVVASLVSTVSNILLALLVSLIARKVLRPDTVPKEYSFIFSGIFLSNYINTTVLPLALNGNILGMESVTYLRFLNFINFAEVKIFKDFTSDWYALISPYYLNIILIVLISPLVSLGIASIWNCFTHYRVRKACESSDKDNQITQKEANARLTTGVFPFAQEQSKLVLYLFIVIMYSGLIPLMVPIFTGGLIVWYFCKKAILLHYSLRVPANENLDSKTINIIPFMILVHSLFSVWSHTAPDIFASNASLLSTSTVLFNDEIQRIFSDWIILGELGLILAWIVLGNLFLWLISSVQDCCKDELSMPPELVSIESKKYKDRLATTNILGSFKLSNNPHYSHLKEIFEIVGTRKLRMQNSLDTLSDQQFNPENFK